MVRDLTRMVAMLLRPGLVHLAAGGAAVCAQSWPWLRLCPSHGSNLSCVPLLAAGCAGSVAQSGVAALGVTGFWRWGAWARTGSSAELGQWLRRNGATCWLQNCSSSWPWHSMPGTRPTTGHRPYRGTMDFAFLNAMCGAPFPSQRPMAGGVQGQLLLPGLLMMSLVSRLSAAPAGIAYSLGLARPWPWLWWAIRPDLRSVGRPEGRHAMGDRGRIEPGLAGTSKVIGSSCIVGAWEDRGGIAGSIFRPGRGPC